MAAYFKTITLAFIAAVGLASMACAQSTMSCTATSTPLNAPVEDVTALMGDVYIVCTGGTPTPTGQPIPQYHVELDLTTNVTNRLLTGNATTGGVPEAVLAIDDPFPGGIQVPTYTAPSTGAATTQLGCLANSPTSCAINGTGGGFGANGPYNGTPGHPNLFQGSWNPSLPQYVDWWGIPIDPPGTQNRIIRITNVRADASLIGVSWTPVPSTIDAGVSITPVQYPPGGFSFSTSQPVATVLPTLYSCFNFQNSAVAPSGFIVQVQEGFNAAFLPRNFAQYPATSTNHFAAFVNLNGTATITMPVPSASANGLQNVLGFPYLSESGFVTSATGLLGDGTSTGALGLADTGTQLSFQLTNIPTGTTVQVPNTIYMYPLGTTVNATTGPTAATGVAVLVSAAADPSGTTALNASGGSATATYEVLLTGPFEEELAYLPVTLTGSSSNSLGISTTVSPAPQSTVGTADALAPIPRFVNNPLTCGNLIPAPQISVTSSGWIYSRVSETYNSTLTLKNSGTTAINGPFIIVLSGLPTGFSYAPPSNEVAVPVASLLPGQSTSTSVRLNYGGVVSTSITFTPIVYQETSN